jgi:uncharacterized protein (TIRG00374 family)
MDVKPMNKTLRQPASLPKIRLVGYLLTLIIIVLAVVKFLPQITTLENSIIVLRSMSLWLVSLAVAAQVGSYLGSGCLLKAIVNLGQSRLSIFRGTLITMVAASIGLVAGGWLSTAAVTYRLVEKSEIPSEEAVLAGFLPPLYNTALLVIISTAGLVYLLAIHQLSRAQMLTIILLLSIFGVGILLVIYGIKHREKVERLALWIASHMMHLLGRAYDAAPIRNVINNIYIGLKLLLNGRWKAPVLGAGINIIFDMLTLYFLFMAAGHAANPGVLVAGYSVAILLQRGVFFIPGGIGVIESGMVAIYTSLGIPGTISVVVILSYRLISFWIPSLLGFAVAAYLQKTQATIQRQKPL